jgi:putative membrane protein
MQSGIEEDKMKKLSGILLCFAMSGFAASAPGQLSPADRHFMNTAANVDMIEAHVGQMAQAQASDSGVKDFAKRLADDHSQAYTQLLALANKTGETIPRGIDIRRDHAAAQLEHLQGVRFDRAFVKDEISDHEKALAEFKREAAHGNNPDVKALASQTIPTLEQHLNTARQLAKSESRGPAKRS